MITLLAAAMGSLLLQETTVARTPPDSQMVVEAQTTEESGDALVVKQLAQAGSNLTKPHPIDFYLYAPDQAAAKTLAESIGADFSVKYGPSADSSGQWLVIAHKDMLPDVSAFKQIRQNFSTLAEKVGGNYDGWDTVLVK